jgi:chromosome segregation ATPase
LNLDGASSEEPAKPAKQVMKQIAEEKEDLKEKVEEIRRSVDLARLQRENEQLLSQLAAQRAPMQLVLPERKIKTTKPSISQPEHRANIGGLPKSRAQQSRNKPTLAAAAWTIAAPKTVRPKTPGSMLGARRWGEECEDVKAWLKALSDGGEDEFESVSSAAELAQERRRSLMKAVESTEKEEAKVVVKEVKAITPPLTPPPVVNQLPRSRAFRGRA